VPTLILIVFFLAKTLPVCQAETTLPSKETFLKITKKLHLPFIANQGQADGRVLYYANTFGGTVFVTHTGNIVYSLPCLKGTDISPHNAISTHGVAIREEILGGKIKTVRGENKTITNVNYLRGSNSSEWKMNISTYDTISLGEIYNGIVLKLRAYGNNVEKLFYIAPRANPELIQLKLEGAKSIRVNAEGALEVLTEPGMVSFTKPFAFQEIDGKTVEIEAKYRIQNSTCSIKNTGVSSLNPELPAPDSQLVYGFELGKYDTTKELIIDPLLASTYIGGSEQDTINSIVIGTDSNIFITGSTTSSDFPTTSGVYDSSKSTYAEDVFISKFDSELTNLLASTFLGGSSYDFGETITINPWGYICVTGYTSSSDFPTTSGAYSASFNGGPYDVFVSILDDNLTTIYASTFMGGASSDRTSSAVIDSSGYVYVAGYTTSSDFPTTSGAYDTTYDSEDSFIAKLDSDLSNLTASTYLGGSAYDRINSITMDSDGIIYVCGRTSSSDFPTTASAYDTTYNDTGNIEDVFVSKFNTGLTNLIASTYLGGSTYDYGNAIAIDKDGNIFVAGITGSTEFPTPDSNAYDTSSNGGTDAFISKFSGNLSKLITSTFIGGSSEDSIEGIVVDSTGNVYITGKSASDDFPATAMGYDTSFSGDSDAYIAKLNGDLMNLLASTLLGGSFSENGSAIAINSGGHVYITGFTESDDFPTTDTAYETTYNDKGYAFVSKLDSNLSSSLPVATTLSATTITTTSAILNGTVNANDFSTTAWFEYDTSSGSYRKTTSSQIISGSDDTSMTANLSGLSSGTTYYFRLAAENKEGASYGDEASFATLSVTNTISGSVVDSSGIAIADAKVQCKGKTTKTKKSTTSGATGFFELTGLEADTYTITAKKKGYKQAKQTVELAENETDEIDIELVLKTKK